MRFMFDPRVWRRLECPYGESPYWVDVKQVHVVGGDDAPAFVNQRWHSGHPPRRFLTDGLAIDGPRPERWLAPPDFLLQEFIGSDASEEHFRVFASKYGLLGGDLQNRGELDGRLVALESYDEWAREHAAIRRVLNQLRPAARGMKVVPGLPRGLGRRVPGDPGDNHEIGWVGRESPLLRALRFVPETPDYSGLRAPRTAVVLTVNAALERRRLVRVEVQWDEGTSTGTFRVVPLCLIGLLWLDLAMLVTATVDHMQCTECGRWFKRTGTTSDKRADAKYCSPNCRLRAHRGRRARQRRDDARLLARKGLSVERVAKTLGARVSNVRRWLETEE